jgi:putative ribosome biogenesis GTPase RsgA
MQKALDWLDAHPDQVDGSLRALAGQIGVGKSTVGEARQEWYRQQRLAQAASTNGHGEPV